MIKLFNPTRKIASVKAKKIVSLFTLLCFMLLNLILTPLTTVKANSNNAKAKEVSIKKVIDPDNLVLYNKTSLSDVINLLPKTVSVIMSDNTNSSAKVSWDTSKYQDLVKSTKSFNLSGSVEGTNQKAKIKVIVLDIYIVEVKQPDLITVPNGTAVNGLNLPQYVSVIMSNRTIEKLEVSWDTASYDGNVSVETKYVLSGTIKGTSVTTTLEIIVEAPDAPAEAWTLVWSDEFDGTASTPDSNGLDLSKWGYQNGTGAQYGLDGWGNNELQYYSKDNIEVKDGNLIIKPKLETREGKPYTSGRIWTSPTFSKKYGKFEARIKLPAGTGFWPAFWMMPKNDVYGGWAASGEIDIMEARGRLTDHVGGTLHYGGGWPKNIYSGSNYYFPEGQSITDFHDYAIEWEPGEIRWYVDGILYQTQSNWYTVGRDGEEKYAFPAPFDQEFYLILNLAIGGNYDGGRQPDPSIFQSNPTMEVDYVRAYELVGRPYKTPMDPKVEKEPLPAGAKAPDSTGNLVNDVNFEKGIKDNREGIDSNFGDGWNFVYNQQFGGQATVNVEELNGRNYAKVNVINAGTQPYSVQLEQHTTLGKGRWYEFSFDAKADKNRTLNAKLGGGPDAGWAVYSDSYTINLTTELKSFRQVFQMTKDSDIRTRIEFNCATSTGPVWIGNVRVAEIDEPQIDYNASKAPLPNSGNHIYNGAFDKYNVDRMAYWNFKSASGTSAAAFVPESTRELNVDLVNGGAALSDVTIDQRGIQLVKNNTYTLTFKARATVDRTIKFKFTSKDDTVTFTEKDINLTTASNSYELSFTMPATDLEAQLAFMLGGSSGKVYLDDVKLLRTTVDYTGVDLYPLKNGGFNQQLIGWETILDSGGAAVFSTEDGAAKIDVTNLGSNPWSIMLIQGNLPLVKGIEYTLSFKARASAQRSMALTLENASYARAFDSQALTLTTEWKTFNFTVKPAVSEVLALKYLLGRVDAAAVVGTVYIDDVVLQVKNPPVKQAPMLIADSTDDLVGQNIDITFEDNEAWRTAITAVKINSQALTPDKYKVTAGNINLLAGNFTAAGSHTISVEAEGYANTSVVQILKANDGKIVQNGTFDSNANGWSVYKADGSSAEVTSENGEMKVYFANYDGWFRWSTQVYQTQIKLEAGKTYLLKFDARSTINKNILFEINKGTGGNHFVSPEVSLTTSNKTFNYEVTITEGDTNAKLNFLLGSNNVPGENFKSHSIYLDNISIEEKTATTPSPTDAVKNGDFEKEIAPWSNWSDGSMTVSSVNGEAEIKLNGFGTDPWSVQFSQDGFKFEPNVKYRLTFSARATIPRSFGVDIEGAGYYRYMDNTANLTTEMKTFSYDFTVTKNEITKMIFFFGKTGEDITDVLRATPHTVYLDNVIIAKVENNGGGETPKPEIITVEAESGTVKAVGADPIGVIEGTAVKAVAPTYIEFNVDIKQTGTYKITYVGKCAPAGIYYELRNSTGSPISGIGAGPSTDWISASHNANLTAGAQILRVFIAPGEKSTAYLDKVTFEIQ